MSISIALLKRDDRRGYQQRTYDVTIDGFKIQTVVTRDAGVVQGWIRDTNSTTIDIRRNIVVGLDVESRPNFIPNARNPVAIVQFCVDNRCLIYQILRRHSNCNDLQRFIAGSGYTFVGVDVLSDAGAKLLTDYGLDVCNKVDLREVAVGKLGDESMKKADLMMLAERFLEVKVEKPKWIASSDWDREFLSEEQVKYAVADAYLCYKLGMVLEAY